jgi:cbb3-type cytochrome oxidase subunit 1
MHWRNRAFITLGLVYALLGGLIGLAWLIAPGWLAGNVPRLHGHIMLLGFITMMIYGIGLHVLPRFSGFPLFSERLANWQFYIANVGLWLLLASWLLPWANVGRFGGLVSWVAMVLFAMNIMLTVKARGPAG